LIEREGSKLVEITRERAILGQTPKMKKKHPNHSRISLLIEFGMTSFQSLLEDCQARKLIDFAIIQVGWRTFCAHAWSA